MRSALIRSLLPVIVLLPLALRAQNMQLTNSTLTVDPGTRIALVGPIDWTIGTDASVINNGRIELGDQAVVAEPEGNPITGTGTEHALYASQGPAADVEPGGLGLTLTMTAALGDMEVVRGHSVQMPGTGAESVARWFNVLATPAPGEQIDIGFHYDPVELNGLVEANLLLHGADQLTGPWSSLNGTVDLPTHRIASSWSSPWGFITAFDDDITSVAGEAGVGDGFTVWPTITDDVLHIRSMSGAVPMDITLLDAAGRIVEHALPNASRELCTLSLAGQPSGLYVLRVNGTRTFRIIHP
ncbi:MAG: T9SS type A sorting domain-containing protein [Flavobacteriales bacterium]